MTWLIEEWRKERICPSRDSSGFLEELHTKCQIAHGRNYGLTNNKVIGAGHKILPCTAAISRFAVIHWRFDWVCLSAIVLRWINRGGCQIAFPCFQGYYFSILTCLPLLYIHFRLIRVHIQYPSRCFISVP